MVRKELGLAAALLGLSLLSGCCSWCDRWCSQRQPVACQPCYYPPPQSYAAPANYAPAAAVNYPPSGQASWSNPPPAQGPSYRYNPTNGCLCPQ